MDGAERIARLEQQIGTWGREDFHDLRTAVHNHGLALAKIDGKLDAIAVRIAANAEQREAMQQDVTEIKQLAKETNGRLRKAEADILNLQSGASHLSLQLGQVQRDGSGPVDVAPRTTVQFTRGQKVTGGGALLVLALAAIQLLKDVAEVVAPFLKAVKP